MFYWEYIPSLIFSKLKQKQKKTDVYIIYKKLQNNRGTIFNEYLKYGIEF